MGLVAKVLRREPARSFPSMSLSEYFSFLGSTYQLAPSMTMQGEKQETPSQSFEGYVQGLYAANGVVFACMAVRMLLFSEARFQFRRMQSGRPGELFGGKELAKLEKPWPNGTTGDLLVKAITDVDLAGNFFAARRPSGIKRLHPGWVTIVLGSPNDPQADANDIDAEVMGYIYKPGGKSSSAKEVVLLPREVAHWAPIPDPRAHFRGMSWLTPVLREVMSDAAATTHKLRFFENGATPNMVVTLSKEMNQEAFERWISLFEDRYGGDAGITNAYRTMYLAGGASAEVVGANMQQISFKETQGAGETRIAAAAGVPPIIVGLSEGLQSATYSNYGQARRRFADGTMRPLWRSMAASLSTLISVPVGAELWYDDRDIPFLQEDQKDAAEVQQLEAATIQTLINAGFDPDTAVQAVIAGDFKRLTHSGLVSVQLQPPGAADPTADAGRALAELIGPHLHENGRKEERVER